MSKPESDCVVDLWEAMALACDQYPDDLCKQRILQQMLTRSGEHYRHLQQLIEAGLVQERPGFASELHIPVRLSTFLGQAIRMGWNVPPELLDACGVKRTKFSRSGGAPEKVAALQQIAKKTASEIYARLVEGADVPHARELIHRPDFIMIVFPGKTALPANDRADEKKYTERFGVNRRAILDAVSEARSEFMQKTGCD